MTREECCAVVAEKDMPRTVYDMIVAMQEKYAERPAFRWVDDATKTVKEKTYGQFVEDIRKMTSYLQANVADVKGQRIVILSRTNYEYGVVTFGTVMAGAVIVTLNQKKTWPELEYELGLSEPALIFTDGIDYGYADELKAAYGDKLRPMNAYEGSTPAELANRIDTNALMMLMFTSGTTGRSKGVMLSEKNYFSAVRMYVAGQAAVMRKAQELAPKDMDKPFSHFTLVPMFHLSGFICYFAYGIHGWTLNLCADPRDVRRDMSMMHSDAKSNPPVLVEMIYNEIRRGNHYDAIIMDPPSYGRGPKGEIWKIEESVYPLIKLCAQLLTDKPLFFLVNSYTTGLAPAVLTYMLATELKKFNGTVDSQEIGLPVTQTNLVLPCGASGRWESKKE